MKPIDVSATVDVPAEAAFAYVADFERNPTWQSGVVSAEFTSEGPVGEGSTYRQTAKFLGQTIETAFEVTRFEPGRLVRIESTGGTFPIQVTRRVTPVEGGARVSATIEGQPGGLFGLLGPLLRWVTRRRIERDYARLQRVLAERRDGSD